jgi:hypothetical protein
MRAACLVAFASSLIMSVAATAAQTPPAGPAKPPDPVKAMGDIVFYLASGNADACGHGCNEWIAAEGKIDGGAAQRLRRLLAKLGQRKPILVFHSPGGLVDGSIELGRLIREQKLTTSVGHTIPRDCDREKPLDKACEALKRSGQELAADLELDGTMCNSGCVYALAGGATRLVPPGVKLGIHDVGFDPDKPQPRGAQAAEAKRILHGRLENYLRDMGMDKSLSAAAFAVPFETAKPVARDELARFGIDRREFGETAWQFADKPTPLLQKGFFARAADGSPPAYRTDFVALICFDGHAISLALAEERTPSAPKAALPSRIGVNGTEFELVSKIDSPTHDIRAAPISMPYLDSLDNDATLTLSRIAGNEDEAARDLTLNMDGFWAAYVKLKNNCNKPPNPNPFASAGVPQWATPSGLAKTFGSYIGRFQFPSPSASKAPGDPQTSRAASNASPPPVTIEIALMVAVGEKVRLDTIRPNCALGPMTLSILQFPQHGELTVENDRAGACNPNGALIFYKPSPGYVGADATAVNVEYPGAASSRRYVIDVAAPRNAPPATEIAPRFPRMPARPAQVYQFHRVAAAGERVRLDTFQPNCATGAMSLSIIQNPQHGALTIEHDPTDPCGPAVFFYEPAAAYAGPDSITFKVTDTLKITDSFGRGSFDSVTPQLYSIEVK